MLKRILSILCCLALLAPAALAQDAGAWDCPECGQAGNTGNFCINCGRAKPQDGPWDCPDCGQAGNTGNFCINCGKPRPVDNHWTCPNCAHADNTGNFCGNCGAPKPGSAVRQVAATPTPRPTATPTPKPTATPTPRPTATPTPRPTATPTPKATLSPDNKCPVQPTIYCSPRQKSISSGKISDLKQLSAGSIKKYQGSLDYGLYFKFTPKAKDDGYVILRFDYVITGPDGTVEVEEGFNDYMECRKNYYWYWQFFTLQNIFDRQIRQSGSVTTGTYRMDIYFNGLWAGKQNFTVKK